MDYYNKKQLSQRENFSPTNRINPFPNSNRRPEGSYSQKSHQRKEKPESKVDQLIKNIYRKHEEMKTHIKKLRIEKQAQEEEEFRKLTFSPKISKTQRYQINGLFFDRQKAKLEEHRKFCRSKSIQNSSLEMKQCKFRPELISKKTSDIYLSKRKARQFNLTTEMYLQQNMEPCAEKFLIQQYEQAKREGTKKEGPEPVPYRAMKQMIKFQLQRAKLA